MYPYLRRGNRLPSVVALQILLNRAQRSGGVVEVDGAFGPKTEAAVRDFQRQKGKEPDGVVGEQTWPLLAGPDRLQVLDSIDIAHIPDIGIEDEAIKGAGGKPILNYGQCGGGVGIIEDIQSQARHGKVVLLRFHGHGSPGWMGLAAGKGGMGGVAFQSGWIGKIVPKIAFLASVFAPYGSAELHGCRVGAGAQGRLLCQTLATAWRVPVTAGITTQYGGGRTTFRFEGPTYTAFPTRASLLGWAQSIPGSTMSGGR
jgi:hypothetical protein